MAGEWTVGVEVDGKLAVDDAGEAVTLADTTGDAWVFHIVGSLPGFAQKAVWAAQRVPKGHAAFVANNFILGDVPEQPTKDFLYSSNIFKVAEKAGFWSKSDGKPLNFARVYAPDTTTFITPIPTQDKPSAPIPLYASLRLWRLMNLVAPSKKYKLELDPLKAFPAFVKAEKKIENRDLFRMHGETYAGTEFDMSKGALAGPFGNP